MLQLEVTRDDSVSQFADSVLKRTNGRVDVLINNVGTGILGAAEESSVDQVKRLFDINYFGSHRSQTQIDQVEEHTVESHHLQTGELLRVASF